MSVYDHPTKPGWQMIKISHGRKGKPDYIPYPGTREDALIYEREIRGLTDTTDPGFTDRLPEFRTSYRNRSSERGMEVCENSLKHLEAFFGTLKLRHITPHLIEQYKAARLKAPAKTNRAGQVTATVKPRTVNIELSILSAYFEFMNQNHGTQLAKPQRFRKRDTAAPMPIPLLPAELAQIINNLQGNIKTIVALMAYNGLRRNEAFNLQAQDVDINGGNITIRGKGNKWRVVPVVAPELLELLKEAKSKIQIGTLLPNEETGQPYKDIRKAIRGAAKRAGITKHINPHLFRHSFGTALVGADINLRIIQGLLGHSEIATTQIYTHLNTATLKQGASAMAQLVANVATAQNQ